jgi:hypothetical protein
MQREPRPERSRLHDLLADERTRLSWDQLEAFGDEWEQLNPRQRMEAMRRAHEAELNR